MKEYKSLKVEPHIHEMVKSLSGEEGRNVTKMIEILIETYKKSNVQKEQ